jgi:branched-chain amino acid transport system substrate-binding protein
MKRRDSILLALFLGTATIGSFVAYKNQKESKLLSDEINVVALLPLTGTSSDIGRWQQQGIEIAKSSLNADPTQPKKVSVLYEDTASDVKTALSSFEKTSATAASNAYLISLSSVANALAPRFSSNNQPALLLAVSLPKITQRSDNYFRFNLGSEQEAERMAEYLKKTELKRIAVLSINDEFGQGAREAFLRNLKGTSASIVYDDAYDKNQTDFRSIILRLSNSKPDAVYVIGYVKSSILLIRQMRELGVKSRVFANMALSVPAFQRLGGTALDGATYTVTDFRLDSPAPRTQQFIKAYQERYRETPTFFAAFAHDSLITLAQAKATSPQAPLKTSLSQLKPFDAATGTIKFNDLRNLVLKVRVVRNQDGKLKNIE